MGWGGVGASVHGGGGGRGQTSCPAGVCRVGGGGRGQTCCKLPIGQAPAGGGVRGRGRCANDIKRNDGSPQWRGMIWTAQHTPSATFTACGCNACAANAHACTKPESPILPDATSTDAPTWPPIPMTNVPDLFACCDYRRVGDDSNGRRHKFHQQHRGGDSDKAAGQQQQDPQGRGDHERRDQDRAVHPVAVCQRRPCKRRGDAEPGPQGRKHAQLRVREAAAGEVDVQVWKDAHD